MKRKQQTQYKTVKIDFFDKIDDCRWSPDIVQLLTYVGPISTCLHRIACFSTELQGTVLKNKYTRREKDCSFGTFSFQLARLL